MSDESHSGVLIRLDELYYTSDVPIVKAFLDGRFGNGEYELFRSTYEEVTNDVHVIFIKDAEKAVIETIKGFKKEIETCVERS